MADDEVIELLDDTTFHAIWPLYEDDGETPLDVTGWTVAAQIRASSGTEVLETFVAELELGQLSLQLDPEVRAWKKARFDVRLTSPEGDVSRPVRGRVINSQTITRVV